MLEKFKHHLIDVFPSWPKSKLVLACSGGLDSMVLAHLLLASKADFDLVHCNFKLRGEASDEDEAFVKKWAKDQGKKVYTRSFDLSDTSGSIQLKARLIRYQWFFELMAEYKYEYLVTAHHLNDSLETFLINLSRGTGIEGLTGIPENTNKVVRPLLPFSRREILEYAQQHQISWREDASNSDVKYLRNKIRHRIIPELETLHPTFYANFLKTQAYLEHSAQLLEAYKGILQKELFHQEGEAIHIAIEQLSKLHPKAGYFYLLFREYGFPFWKDIEALMGAASGKELCSATHRLIKDRDALLLVAVQEEKEAFFFLFEAQKDVKNPINLQIETVSTLGPFAKNTLYVDKEKLNYPLKIRKWKIGDYFYPLGMKGRKKIAKFFKDEKYNTVAKEAQWLLCSGDKVVWIIGKRADERFKVSATSTEIVKITVI
ncbi:MAG: tRNA lysidine(34) synthetase TilS [Bacteroidota bacterium]